MMISRTARWTAGTALGLALAGAVSTPAAHLVLTNNRRVEGTEVRVNARGEYVLTTPGGQRTYGADQVLSAEADKPAAYDQALQLAQSGQYDQALAILSQIAERYRKLGWDDRARFVTARVHLRQGRHEEAADSFARMSEPFRALPEVRLDYWKTLLAAGEYTTLEPLLDQAIAGADRGTAARAQILRGDLKRKRRQLHEAVRDYLRTYVLFKAVQDVQPEALYKAGEVLEELRDTRAKDLFATLVKTYPASEYAVQSQQR